MRPRRALSVALIALAIGLVDPLHAASDASPGPAPTSEAYDYMVQNVCVDDHDRALPISPLDDKCTRQRNLRLGEALPYHKYDWPAEGATGQAAKLGYQRDDTLPVFYPGAGYFVLGTMDFGDAGRHFGVYDGEKGDGLSLISVSGDYVGSAMTFDHTGGVQLFVNPDHCHGTVDLDALTAGWLYAPSDLSRHPSGTTLSGIKRVQSLGEACPAKHTWQTTHWYLTDFAPMSKSGSAGKKTLKTLVTEHFAGKSADKFNNLERMYFSRELGRMRWERWQNLARQERDKDAELAEDTESSGRCIGGVGAPQAPGKWVMIRCREWTNIVPADDPAGDRVDEWLSGIAGATRAGPLLNLKTR